MNGLCITVGQAAKFQKKAKNVLKWQGEEARTGDTDQKFFSHKMGQFAQWRLERFSAKVVNAIYDDLKEKKSKNAQLLVVYEEDKKAVAKEIADAASKEETGLAGCMAIKARSEPLLKSTTIAEFRYFRRKNNETKYLHQLWFAEQLVKEVQRLLGSKSAKNH